MDGAANELIGSPIELALAGNCCVLWVCGSLVLHIWQLSVRLREEISVYILSFVGAFGFLLSSMCCGGHIAFA